MQVEIKQGNVRTAKGTWIRIIEIAFFFRGNLHFLIFLDNET